jgi:hypothetical protein
MLPITCGSGSEPANKK